MAIQLEFINLVIPIQTIEAKYPGGWARCLEDHDGALWGRVWHDDHLFRDGTMNSLDMEDLVKRWISLGFTESEGVGDERTWKDFCVTEQFFGSHHPCPWLTVDAWTAHLAGTEPGTVMGRGGSSSYSAANCQQHP